MLIWSGWGCLVVLVWVPIAAALYSLTKHMANAPVQMVAIVLLGSLVTSGLIWGLNRLVHKLTVRTLIDQSTGVAFIADATGSLFFIRTRFWVYLVPLINLGLMWAYWR